MLFLLIAVLLLLELAYRSQIIEFYGPEFRALNSGLVPQDENSDFKVLVIGDSFSAQKANYVDQLRKMYPKVQFINASVPGIGLRQQNLILNKRLRTFSPDLVLYQMYVGNDLSDLMHPWYSDAISLTRRVYWWMSEKLLVVPYLNFRLSRLKRSRRISADKTDMENPEFGVLRYRRRARLYIEADPNLIASSITLEDRGMKRYELWKTNFRKFIADVPSNSPVELLLIPHCTQVSQYYYDNYIKLGAVLSKKISETNYPLSEQIEMDFPNVIVHNTLRELQTLSGRDSLYYSNDPHFSTYGQLEFAKIISKRCHNLPR